MNALTIKLLTGAVIATLTIGGISYTGAQRLTNAKAGTDTLVSKITVLQADVTTLDALIKQKNDLLLKYDGTVTYNKAEKDALIAQISDLTNQKTTLENNIVALTTQLNSSTADQGTIDALQAEITRLEGEITKANTEAEAMETKLAEALATVGTAGDTATNTNQYNVALQNDVSSTPTTTPAPTPSPTPAPTTYATATSPNITNPDMYKTLAVNSFFTPANIETLEAQLGTKVGDTSLVITEVIVNGVNGFPTIDFKVATTKSAGEVQTAMNQLTGTSGNLWYTMHNEAGLYQSGYTAQLVAVKVN